MAYMTIFVKDLVELKTRRGTATTAVLARVVGLNYPPTDAEVYYEWDNNSIAVGDDYNIVHPTTGGTLPGRWFKRKIEELDPTVPQYVKDISQSDIDYWDGKQDPITAGEGLTKTGVTLAVDNAEVVRSNRELIINGLSQNLSANRTWNVGDILSTGSYANPSWITSLAASKIPGLSNVATSGSYPDLINKPSIPTTTSDLINNSNFIVGNGLTTEYIKGDGSKAILPNFITTETDPTVPAYSKSLTAFSVIKTSTDPLYKSISYTPSSSEITTALGITPINQAGARTAISLTTTGTGAAQYNSTTGVLNIPTPVNNTYTAGTGISINSGLISNTSPDQTVTLTAGNRINITGTYPNFTISYIEPVINQVSRNVNTNYTISTTRQSTVYYSIPVTATNPALTGTSVGTAFLEYSTNGGTNWTTALPTSTQSGVALSVTIQLTTGGSNVLCGAIPANALVRIRTTISGTATVGNAVGQEVY